MDELEKFYNLPQDLQDAIVSEKTALTVYDLGEQAGLDEDGIGKIGSLVKAVLMKEFPLSDFKTELELRTQLDVDRALKIAEIIDKEIFDPVKIYLLKKEEKEVEQKEEPKEINVFEKQSHVFKDGYREMSED
ncbi:MAG: hypothetical protein PHY30_01375 [Candidatus Pacebacteria bacterium]|nr:hypothetical protein [Candidatus Paceibacterota bacterium]